MSSIGGFALTKYHYSDSLRASSRSSTKPMLRSWGRRALVLPIMQKLRTNVMSFEQTQSVKTTETLALRASWCTNDSVAAPFPVPRMYELRTVLKLLATTPIWQCYQQIEALRVPGSHGRKCHAHASVPVALGCRVWGMGQIRVGWCSPF